MRILSVIFIFATVSLQGQNIFNVKQPIYSITVAEQDTVYVFRVSKEEVKKVEPNMSYYWFGNGVLQRTTGNYSGKLLDGVFEKFDRNRKLVEKGQFESGLKTGTWQQWYDNGNLFSVYEWKNSQRSGDFNEYYPDGAVMRTGAYKKGKPSGTIVLYADDGTVMIKSRFRDGELVREKVKSETPKEEDSTKEKKRGLFKNKNKEEKVLEEPSVIEDNSTPAEKPAKERKKKKSKKDEAVQPANDGGL